MKMFSSPLYNAKCTYMCVVRKWNKLEKKEDGIVEIQIYYHS